MTNSIHFIEKCICGNTLAQCRCPSPNKTVHINNNCKCPSPGAELPKFAEPYLSIKQLVVSDPRPLGLPMLSGKFISKTKLQGFERAANIVVQLEQYCDKFTVPLTVKELRKILAGEDGQR